MEMIVDEAMLGILTVLLLMISILGRGYQG
jgi:hypothetical protein